MCRVRLAAVAALVPVVCSAVDLSTPEASAENLDRVLRASCRIFAGTARGSGVIFDSDADSYHVLTNAHVVGRRGNRVEAEFEHSGYRSGRIAGRVVRSQIAPNSSLDLAIVELPRSAFPGPMPVLPLAEVMPGAEGSADGDTVLTVGAQGGAAVSLQRGHVVRQTPGLIYYKPEALPGRSGSPLINATATAVIGLVAWRTGDGQGLAMSTAAITSFLRGEVADVGQPLPDDAVPLWQNPTRLYLVTSEGCGPCELQKTAIPPGVKYQTVDVARVNAKGYNVRVTPTLMVFVDGELQSTSSGLLRGTALRTFLRRWGFIDNPPHPDNGNADTNPDDFRSHNDDPNPWTNPDARWRRGPIRDRIDNAKDRFAWWVLGRWAAYVGGFVGFLMPWVLLALRLKANNPPRRGQPNRRKSHPTRKQRRSA